VRRGALSRDALVNLSRVAQRSREGGEDSVGGCHSRGEVSDSFDARSKSHVVRAVLREKHRRSLPAFMSP